MNYVEHRTLTNDELFDLASATWGVIPQAQVAVEEFSELTKAICKYFFRGKNLETSELLGELADAQIMIDQIKRIVSAQENIDADAQVKQWMSYKLDRLEMRLSGKPEEI